jgi:cobalt-zinc-cadmium efflux system outer membrane protein
MLVNLKLLKIAFCLLIIWTIGCASSNERDAFDRFHEEARHSYPDVDKSRMSDQLPEINENSTLEDYLAYAALNNPGLKASFYRWKEALEKITQSRSLPDPRFNYTYFIKEVETRVGPQEQKIGLMQTFPWLSKLKLREKIAVENANAMQQKYEKAKLKLFFQVKKYYYEYYYLERAIDIMRKNIDLVKYLEEIVRSKYRTGKEGYANVIKAELEIDMIIDRLKRLEDLRKPVAAKLNEALNRPADTPITQLEPVSEKHIEFSEDELIDLLMENNPELKILCYEIEKEKGRIDLAGKNYFPDFTIGAEYIDTDEASNNTPDSGKDPVMVMFSINIPIWYDKYRAGEKEAYAKWRAANHSIIEASNSLIADVKMAFYQFSDDRRRIRLYRNNLIPKGIESLEVTQKGFEAGKIDFTDLVDAERTILEFHLSYERALADHAQSLAKLEMLIGKGVSP